MVAASLLIVGPNPAQAAADKHGSGHSGSDYRKNGSSGQGSASQGASNWVNDALNLAGVGGTSQSSKPNPDPPPMNLGISGSDVEDLPTVSSLAADGQATAMRSAAVAEAPVGDNLSVAAPRLGSDYSGQSVMSFRSPRVVFGNGRTPGTQVPRTASTSEALLMQDTLIAADPALAAPAVPEAIEIDIPPLPPPVPPVERIRPAALVLGEFGTGTADTVTDPLAGVAGLFLIPAIGAVLGHRQARAAQSLRESLRS